MIHPQETPLPRPPTVLIFIDDDEMRELIFSQTRSLDCALLQARNFQEAFAFLGKSEISLILTNSKISDMSLADFLTRVREMKADYPPSILVLMVPSKSVKEEDVMKAGANDTLFQPFEARDLISKMKALLKKRHPQFDQGLKKIGRITYKNLILDLPSFDVFLEGERLKLTPSEFKLLQSLLEHLGEVLTRDQLIELVQGAGVVVIDRAVDTHVFSLRKKLGNFGHSIETVRGEGYRLKEF